MPWSRAIQWCVAPTIGGGGGSAVVVEKNRFRKYCRSLTATTCICCLSFETAQRARRRQGQFRLAQILLGGGRAHLAEHLDKGRVFHDGQGRELGLDHPQGHAAVNPVDGALLFGFQATAAANTVLLAFAGGAVRQSLSGCCGCFRGFFHRVLPPRLFLNVKRLVQGTVVVLQVVLERTGGSPGDPYRLAAQIAAGVSFAFEIVGVFFGKNVKKLPKDGRLGRVVGKGRDEAFGGLHTVVLFVLTAVSFGRVVVFWRLRLPRRRFLVYLCLQAGQLRFVVRPEVLFEARGGTAGNLDGGAANVAAGVPRRPVGPVVRMFLAVAVKVAPIMGRFGAVARIGILEAGRVRHARVGPPVGFVVGIVVFFRRSDGILEVFFLFVILDVVVIFVFVRRGGSFGNRCLLADAAAVAGGGLLLLLLLLLLPRGETTPADNYLDLIFFIQDRTEIVNGERTDVTGVQVETAGAVGGQMRCLALLARSAVEAYCRSSCLVFSREATRRAETMVVEGTDEKQSSLFFQIQTEEGV